MSSTVSRILGWVIAFVCGAVYGTAAAVAQGFTIAWMPVGLLIAVVGSVAFLAALRILTGDRWATLAGGAGMLVPTLLFANVGPGGSAIVAAPSEAMAWVPLTWTLVLPIMVGLAVAWPDLSNRRA